MMLHNRLSLMSLPYQRSLSAGPVKSPSDFTDTEFVEQFRFKKEHFYEILHALKDENGRYMA
eukprot:765028-Hanusia_phi.AAC.3